MKKLSLWVLLTVLVLALALSACNQSDNNTANAPLEPADISEEEVFADQGAAGDSDGLPAELLETGQQATPVEEDPSAVFGPAELARVVPGAVLLGYPIENLNGEEIGTVADLFIDLQTSQVNYVFENEGAALNQGIVIPWQAFIFPEEVKSNGQGLQDAFYLNIDREMLSEGPVFEAEAIDFSDPYWDTGLYTFWDPLLPKGAKAPNINDRITMDQDAGFLYAAPLTRLLDAPVRSLADEPPLPGQERTSIGQIRHVMINPVTGQVVYVVVTADPALGIGERWIPVPLGSLTITENQSLTGDGFGVLADPSLLIDAPNFAPGELPEAGWDLQQTAP